jgi:DNA-binding HxlR family transcriptional regulator/putative sterol carrier protein
MDGRRYGQYCSLAYALDVVGERWTLLVVRDLLLGPQRFTDLLDGLPGIGRNLLTARLRSLEAEGLVCRSELPPPAASKVYALTQDGLELGLALAPLARWGAQRMGTRRDDDDFRPVWIAMAMSASADLEAARGVHETYQLEVDNDVFHVRVDNGRVVPHAQPAGDPTVVIRMATDTLVEILGRTISPADALTAGRLTVDGPLESFSRCVAIFMGATG